MLTSTASKLVSLTLRQRFKIWLADTEEAHRAWHRYVAMRRTSNLPKRRLADILIGAFAARLNDILTRNEPNFRRVFPTLAM